MSEFGSNFMQMMSMLGVMANSGLGRNNDGMGSHHHCHGGQGQGGGMLGNLAMEASNIAQSFGGLLGGFGLGRFGQNGFDRSGMGQSGFGQSDAGGRAGWPMGGLGGFGGGQAFCGSSASQSPWTVTNTGSGQDHIDLGGYTLDLDKSNMGWNLTNKQTGAVTSISGDPHVSENGNTWDFKNNLSLQLDDGTRITAHTIPYGNGATVSSELDITKGGHGMKVSNLGGSADGGQLQVQDGLNGYALDASNFGTNTLFEDGNNWATFNGQDVARAVAAREGF